MHQLFNNCDKTNLLANNGIVGFEKKVMDFLVNSTILFLCAITCDTKLSMLNCSKFVLQSEWNCNAYFDYEGMTGSSIPYV